MKVRITKVPNKMQTGGKTPSGSFPAKEQRSSLYNSITYPGDTLTNNQLRSARNNMAGTDAIGHTVYVPDQGTEQYRKLSIYNPSKKDLAKMKKLGYNMEDILSMGDYRMDDIPAPNTYIDTNAFNPSNYRFGGYTDGGEVYNGNVKKMNPDGTIDHNYYEGSSKGAAKGKGRVIPKGYRKGEGNFRFDQTAADPYTGNIPGLGGWDNVEDGSVPGTDAGSPTPNNMNTLSIGDNIGTTQSGSTQPTGSGQENRKQGPRFDYSTPDKFAIANSLYNAANLHKYMPWEAPVSAVTPDVVFMDPTRALAANSEQANSAQQVAALSGNNKAARANSSAIQGQGAVGAANIIGDYNNRNVAIANQAGEQYANITNQLLQQKAARANRLYQGTVTANQQYDNSSRDARADIIGQYSNAYKNRAAKDSINQTNQYYYLDNQDRITFRTPDDETAYRALMSGKSSGNSIDAYNKAYENAYKNASSDLDEDERRDLADRIATAASGMKDRTRTTSDGSGKTKSTTTTKSTTKQYGGYTHSPLAKFFRNKEGK